VAGPDQRFRLRAERLINAAGLGAVPLTGLMDGLPEKHRPEQRFAKGHYFKLRGKPPAERLIYPLPDADGLGVHLTLDLAGGARFGPDVEWVERPDYRVDESRRESFEQAVRRYWPGLPAPQAVAGRQALPGLSDPGPGGARYRRPGKPARH
jgi:L-2-hydroxyglutarate oxidase LhgO